MMSQPVFGPGRGVDMRSRHSSETLGGGEMPPGQQMRYGSEPPLRGGPMYAPNAMFEGQPHMQQQPLQQPPPGWSPGVPASSFDPNFLTSVLDGHAPQGPGFPATARQHPQRQEQQHQRASSMDWRPGGDYFASGAHFQSDDSTAGEDSIRETKKYKCSRCGQIKANHVCPFVSYDSVAVGLQADPSVLVQTRGENTLKVRAKPKPPAPTGLLGQPPAYFSYGPSSSS